MWTQLQGIELCKLVESVCPKFGCHVALTGGLLYHEGDRKDCDLLFYRIRQTEFIDEEGLWTALKTLGFEDIKGFGWCYKATLRGQKIDMFFPEEIGGEYVPGETPDIFAEL